MNRGEVRWFKFRSPDKHRPVVIVTRSGIIPHIDEVTVAPLTTHIRNIPTEVALTTVDGVPSDCVINCDHLQTVRKARLGKVITNLRTTKLVELGRAIAFALGL